MFSDQRVKNYTTNAIFGNTHITTTDTMIRQRPDDAVYKQSKDIWFRVPENVEKP